MPAGRPLKLEEDFGTPEQVAAVVSQYFDSTPENEWTVTGLARRIGLDLDGLKLYAQGRGGRGEFSSVVKEAYCKVVESYEKDLRSNKPVGSIFALKNFGWSDRQDVNVELSGDGWAGILDRVRRRSDGPGTD